MKKTFAIRHHCVAAALALLTLVGTSACKKGESEQKNFKAETGALWWKKEATLVPLPYYLAMAPVPGQTNLAADDSAITLENASKSCWYYSEKPEDPFFSAKAVSPTAVTLDAFFLGMSEGEHKETLKDLKGTWISSAAEITAGLEGSYRGRISGETLTVVAASTALCMWIAGTFAPSCLVVSALFTTSAGQALVASGASVVADAVAGSHVEEKSKKSAEENSAHNFTAKEVEAKLAELVATATAEKRMKLGWKQLQALNDIVMKAPSTQASADVCAKPEQLDRARVAQFMGSGTSTPAAPESPQSPQPGSGG